MTDGLVANKKLFALLQSHGEGTVSAVFSSGIYFTLNDKLLMLHDQSYGTLPFGIAVQGIEGRCKELGLEAGMRVEVDRGALYCGNFEIILKAQHENYSDKFVAPEILKCFTINAEKLLRESGRSALSVYSSASVTDICKNDIEDIFARTAYRGLVELEAGLTGNDSCKLESALMRLVGLGRGLTPALDDFLCGILFMVHFLDRHCGIRLAALDKLQVLVKKIVPLRTNIYSAAYLMAAAEGEDFSLMRLCVINNGEDEMCEHITKLLNVGGSSGADMLSGMCFAVNFILKQRQFTF